MFNRLSVADAENSKAEPTTLAGVSPVLTTHAQGIGGAGNSRTQVASVSKNYTTIRDWNGTSGETFTDLDLASARNVVLLGSTVARNLFPDADPVGTQVQFSPVPFTVIEC